MIKYLEIYLMIFIEAREEHQRFLLHVLYYLMLNNIGCISLFCMILNQR